MRELRDLAHVPRWGILRVIKRQSVAEHSFFVTTYAGVLCEILDIPSAYAFQTMRMATFHDAAEQFTTDIPGPIKRRFIDAKELKEYEALGLKERYAGHAPTNIDCPPVGFDIIKVADLIDECCYLLGEMRLGNTEVTKVFSRSEIRLEEATRILLTHLDKIEEAQRVTTSRHVRAFINLCVNSERVSWSIDPS